jgi:hypothetical protein
VCQAAYNKCDRKHNNKRNKITHVAHRKGEVRRDEKEIECSYTEHCSKQGRAPASPSRNNHHAKKIDHGKVNDFEIRDHKKGKACAGADNAEAEYPFLHLCFGATRFNREALYRLPGITGYDIDLDIPAPTHEFVEHRPEQFVLPARMRRLSDDDFGYIPVTGIAQDFFACLGPGESNGLCSQALCQAHMFCKLPEVAFRRFHLVGGLDIDSEPFSAKSGGHAFRCADQPDRTRVGANTDEQPFTCRPDLLNTLHFPIALHLLIDPLCSAAEGQFTKREKVPLSEEKFPRPGRKLRDIDLTFPEPLQQVVRREIDKFYFVGPVEQKIRYGLPHRNSRYLCNHIIQAFEMLDIHRGINRDAGA